MGLPTGVVSFLFSDIEGSTQLWEAHGDEMASALALHDRIVESEVDANGGHVFSTAGDAFASAFDSPRAALRSAEVIQRRLADAEWPEPCVLKVRMGLHVGEAHERGGDYFGPTLNRAARIMSAAHGGQALTSSAFAALAGPEGLQELGEYRLKDLGAPEVLWQVGSAAFPPPRTLDAIRHNLPVERTPLVGRADVVEAVTGMLEDRRLVTLLGIGGAGKTRVAVAAGAEVTDRFPDGVWFVDLVPVEDGADVIGAIASAAGLALVGGVPAESLVRALDTRRALFIIDNCEHLTDDVAAVLDTVLGRTQSPRFLATSREPLELVDEVEVALPPLSDAGDAGSPAVELFVEAARRVGAEVAEADLGRVAGICGRLDGHPLSIELAAAQLKQLTVQQLEARLDDRLELLAHGRGGHRHSSLAAVVEDAWSMLDEDGRELLVQLAAFPGAFGLDEIEAASEKLVIGSVEVTLRGLVDRSLVASDGRGRFRLLETVKVFARRQPSMEGAFERHTQWVFDVLRAETLGVSFTSYVLASWVEDHVDDWRAVEDRLVAAKRWPELGELLSRSVGFLNSVDGIRASAAIDRIERYLAEVDPGDRETLGALHLAAGMAGLPARRPDRIQRSGDAAVACLEGAEPVGLAMALVMQSWIISLRDTDRALGLLDRAFEIAESVPSPEVADMAISYEIVALMLAARFDEAQQRLDLLESRVVAEPWNHPANMVLLLRLVADLVADPDSSRQVAEELTQRRVHQRVGAMLLLEVLGFAATADVVETRHRFEEAIQTVETWAPDDGLPDLLLPPAVLALALGDRERCRRYLDGIRHSPVVTQNFLVTIAYRQLRHEVGRGADTPPEESSQELLQDAIAWIATLAPSSPRR